MRVRWHEQRYTHLQYNEQNNERIVNVLGHETSLFRFPAQANLSWKVIHGGIYKSYE
jgi:hypothetical protein